MRVQALYTISKAVRAFQPLPTGSLPTASGSENPQQMQHKNDQPVLCVRWAELENSCTEDPTFR